MSSLEPLRPLSPDDRALVQKARRALEAHGLAPRLTDALGRSIHSAVAKLPSGIEARIERLSERALRRSLRTALYTLDRRLRVRPLPRERLHKGLVAGAGGISGIFGLPALAVELPVTTTLMLRSIADIARAEGEDLMAADAQLACLEVFALGTPEAGREDTELGYYGVRVALSQLTRESMRALAGGGLPIASRGILSRIIQPIAARFGLVVSEKFAAQSIPVLGAIGGAVVNAVFIDHFQNLARAHFTLRRLERKYGTEAVRTEYEASRLEAR